MNNKYLIIRNYDKYKKLKSFNRLFIYTTGIGVCLLLTSYNRLFIYTTGIGVGLLLTSYNIISYLLSLIATLLSYIGIYLTTKESNKYIEIN